MPNIDPTSLDTVLAQIEKKAKERLFWKGSELDRVPKIPFDSIEMNIATGGGLPVGRTSRLFGGPGGCKTLLSLQVAKNAQNIHLYAEELLNSPYDVVKRRAENLLELFPNGMKVAFYDAEGTYDRFFAEAIGVDTENLLVVEGNQIERIGGIMEATMPSVHLHIIDSLSSCVTIDELNSAISDWHRGIKARAWNKVLDHVSPAQDNFENGIIMIDQIRIDQTSGAEYAPGGSRLEHHSACTIHFRRGKWLYNREGQLKDEAPQTANTVSGKPEPAGYIVGAQVKKSKVGMQFRRAFMQHEFKEMGFRKEFELAKTAKWLDVVESSGTWITLPDGSKVQGENQLQEKIKEDADLHKAILDEAEHYIAVNP